MTTAIPCRLSLSRSLLIGLLGSAFSLAAHSGSVIVEADAIADDAQHVDRGAVDDHSDCGPDLHRGALVQAPVPAADHSACRRHGEGDRQAVVLELRLSG